MVKNLLFLLGVATVTFSFGQDFESVLSKNIGNELLISRMIDRPNNIIYAEVSKRGITMRESDTWVLVTKAFFYYDLPGDENFIQSVPKKGNPNKVYLVTSRGRIFSLDYSGTPIVFDSIPPFPGLNALSVAESIAVDDFIVVGGGQIFKSDATISSWSQDTAGLSGAIPKWVDLVNSNTAYLATSNGLFKQALVATTWTGIPSFPESSAHLIFAAKNDDLYAAKNNLLYKSNDLGSTWNIDTAGLEGSMIVKMGDDSVGNIYVIGDDDLYNRVGSRIYKSNFGTGIFHRIDVPIASMNMGESDEIYNHVSGDDSTCYLSTYFGPFKSRDDGVTWVNDNTDHSSNENFDLLRTSNSRIFLSSHQGVFYSDTAANDTSNYNWVKSFPLGSFLTGQTLFSDSSGSIFAKGKKLNLSDTYNSPYQTMRSDDNGSTWHADTSGCYSIGESSWFVSSTGRQYAAKRPLGTGQIILYSKPKTGTWAQDDIGFTGTSIAQVNGWGEDQSGAIYVFTSNATGARNFRKDSPTANWVPDTTGINDAYPYQLAFASNGTLFAGCYDGLYKKTGSAWSKIPQPPTAFGGANNSCFAVAVDSADRIWAAWSYFDAVFNSIGSGIFCSTDMGNSWTQYGPDTITYRKIIPSGKTIYALSYFNGVFSLQSDTTTRILKHENVPNLLSVFPNPVRSLLNVNIPAELSAATFVLEIISMEGKVIYKNNIQASGLLTIATGQLIPGTYLLRLGGGKKHYEKLFVKD